MSIDGDGTPEHVWLPALADLPVLDLSVVPPRVVVVAPHPDDEVLGVGGLLALLAAAGSQVHLVAVTDGEASNPGGSIPPAELAVRRRAETARALGRLGVEAVVTHLGLPDGGADALEQPVLDSLPTLTQAYWLLAPWSGDGHPDHEAVGRACERAALASGAHLLAFPVWAWHWGQPADLPLGRARRVELPRPLRAAKQQAVAEFATQLAPLGPLPGDAPVLTPAVLARFSRDVEVVWP